MNKATKHILAVLVIVIPFYLSAILQKILLNQEDTLAEEFLGYYMLLNALGIASVLLVNKFFLKNGFKVFLSPDRKTIYDIVLGLFLLGAFYFIQSLEQISYGHWIRHEVDRSAITKLLNTVFSNVLHGVIIIGPFTWLNQAFAVLSLAFILNNLWELSRSKSGVVFSILFTSCIFSSLQINNGIPVIISSLILVAISNTIYYKYRSIVPLFIAAILFQTIDLITYWIYVM